MARRVERGEAARAIAAARRSTEDVVLIGALAEGPYSSEETRRLDRWRQRWDAESTGEEFLLYTLDDGSRYAWVMQGLAWMPAGQRLWCTDPRGADQVFCVRQSTILPEVEVLKSYKDLLVMVSGPTHAEVPVVDPSIVAPADTTLGTGVAEDDARQVLRREVTLRRDTLKRLIAILSISVLVLMVFPSYLMAWFLAAYVLVELGRLAWTHRGRSLPQQEAMADLQAVTVTSRGEHTVEVMTETGERYAWSTSDPASGVPIGARVWATALTDGRTVHLVGDAEEGLTRISPRGPARLVTP